MNKYKVIFVELNRKNNKPAFCSSTGSGELIDKIISAIDGHFTFEKKLFADTTKRPEGQAKLTALKAFLETVDDKALYILMGQQVQMMLKNRIYNSKCFKHPISILKKGSRQVELKYLKEIKAYIKSVKFGDYYQSLNNQ